MAHWKLAAVSDVGDRSTSVRQLACWAFALVGLAALGTATCHAQDTGWITFEKCAVVEQKLDIPAQERGFIKSLKVELNQDVAADQVLAELDTELAELELRMATLEHEYAHEIALNVAEVKFQKDALEKVEQELQRHQSISNSVSESEIRRLELQVEQAKLSLIRAEYAQSRAVADEKLKAAAEEAAQLRLTRRRITAPIKGTVTLIKTHPGQAVEAGQPLLEIQDLEQLTIDRMIPKDNFDLAKLVGAEVRVDVGHDGGVVRLSGQITSYDPRVSSSGLIRIHARVKNIRRGNVWVVHPGDNVTMYVAQAQHGNSDQAKASINPQKYR